MSEILQNGSAAWFCVRSHPKHEHIAAQHLRRMEGVEVFLPRIRFRRKIRKELAWVTEALFPNYLFAKFEWESSLRKVHHAPGVTTVIHFGTHWPAIPDSVMHELREKFGNEELHVIDTTLVVGDRVRIETGIFHGLEALVTQVLPARERVRVLLDFLGRQTPVEIATDAVVKQENERVGLF